MTVTNWVPSFIGRQLTRSFNWHFCLDGLELVLTAEDRTHRVHAEEETAYRIQLGMLWTDITLYSGQGAEVKADGLHSPTHSEIHSPNFCGLPSAPPWNWHWRACQSFNSLLNQIGSRQFWIPTSQPIVINLLWYYHQTPLFLSRFVHAP